MVPAHMKYGNLRDPSVTSHKTSEQMQLIYRDFIIFIDLVIFNAFRRYKKLIQLNWYISYTLKIVSEMWK